MYLMSHNSWSFLTPKTFLGKLFKFIAKCQSVSIQEQYTKYNVRLFDLRIKLNNKNICTIAHGLFEYADSLLRVSTDLAYLNSKPDVYVMVSLEVRTPRKDTDKQRVWFSNYCKQLETNYPNIKFCGGSPTYLPVSYYKFKHNIPHRIPRFASCTTTNNLDDLWPWLYAKLHNKASVKEYNDTYKDEDNVYLSLDFVNIQ